MLPPRRSRLAAWLAWLPLLLAAVWLLHLAGHLGNRDEPPATSESCLICLHLADQQSSPVSASPLEPAPIGAFQVPSFKLALWRHEPAPWPRQGAPPSSQAMPL